MRRTETKGARLSLDLHATKSQIMAEEPTPHHRRIFDLARLGGYNCEDKAGLVRTYSDPTVLEIGAHDGEEIPQFRAAAHVWTFEPSPDKAQRIRTTISKNNMSGMTDFFTMAVSNVSGEVAFWVDGENSQQNTVGKPPPWVSQEEFDAKAIKVPVATLDDIWEHKLGKQHITMLKMDTQGHEPQILRGAAQLLRSDPPNVIHTEFAPALMRQAGSSGTDMLRTLYDAGYICFDCADFTPPAMDPAARDIEVYEQYFGSLDFKGADAGAWTDLVCFI